MGAEGPDRVRDMSQQEEPGQPGTRYEIVFTADGAVHENAEAQRQWAAEQAEHKENPQ
jgi:hypothetical protein